MLTSLFPLNSRFRIWGAEGQPLGGQTFIERVQQTSAEISDRLPSGSVVGLMGDNSPDWAVADLALQLSGLVCVPIPTFFVQSQVIYLLEAHQIDAVLMPAEMSTTLIQPWSNDVEIKPLKGSGLSLYIRPTIKRSVSDSELSKLTFTSGSTGAPKGIALSRHDQWEVAESLAQVLKGLDLQRHLAMLPLAVLLENVAGLYAGLLMGADVFLLPMPMTGLSGSSAFDVKQACKAIDAHQIESVILLPEMLRSLTAHLKTTGQKLGSLKFVAVGGGKVSPQLIKEARDQHLPAYEGYGLSEAASVVSLNRPQAERVGSVGRALPHRQIQIAQDGEILFRRSSNDAWNATGDLGHLDTEGYLYVTGRKKNLLITSFGRNVSPEWPESLLLEWSEVTQAVVFGDGQAKISALLHAADPKTRDADLEACVTAVNQQLPDYAQIGSWHRSATAFTYQNGLATANGRPRRDRIEAHYFPK
jgi:long-subunit acyl-CoA synthetase (AMP-forming)